MPLTDLVRHLNRQNNSLPAGHLAPDPFVASNGGVFVHFANLRLESVFLPITDSHTGRDHGHAASLRAYGLTTRNPVSADAVFVLPANDEEFVYLDRLVRTLHALNYLTHQVLGDLQLKVHRRHIMSVPSDHGLAFEEILRPCGLLPEQITLDLDGDGLEDTKHFLHAVANYRQRGYGIALSRFGHSSIDFGLLREARPDIVKLDPLLLASARPLDRLIDQIHELGALVQIEGGNAGQWRSFAKAANIDLIQPRQPLERRLPAAPLRPRSAAVVVTGNKRLPA